MDGTEPKGEVQSDGVDGDAALGRDFNNRDTMGWLASMLVRPLRRMREGIYCSLFLVLKPVVHLFHLFIPFFSSFVSNTYFASSVHVYVVGLRAI